jgi:anti-anti-sigma regulatory factor
MLKIQRSSTGQEVVFVLSGRMDAENLGQLETLLRKEASDSRTVLDLKDLTLVDQEVVSFLRAARRTASSSGIVRHTFVRGSMKNGD